MGFKIGDRVVFVDGDMHTVFPAYYPPPGTVGEVRGGNPYGLGFLVEWEGESTAGNPIWICSPDQIQPCRKRKVKVYRRKGAGRRRVRGVKG